MYTDIVLPKGNEPAFVQMAVRLGFDALVFVYEPAALPAGRKAMKALGSKVKIALHTACLAHPATLQKHPGNLAELFLVRGSEQNRNALEQKNTDIVYDLETSRRGDFIHHRNSGLNQVLAKLAAERDKLVGFSFSTLLSDKRHRHVLIGRVQQNIMLCRKYKVKTVFASFARDPYEMRAPNDLLAILRHFGMDGGDAQKALSLASHRAAQNAKLHKKQLLAKGLEVLD